MEGDETSGPIDFDFFSEESQKSTAVNQKEQRNGMKRLSDGRLTSNGRTVRDDINARPLNGSERTCSTSSPNNSSNSDSDSNSESGEGRSPRSVSSRSTNISVKVPTARDDSEGSRTCSSDNYGHKSDDNINVSDNDRENNNIISRSKRSESPELRNTPQTLQRKSVRPRTAKTRNHKKSWSSDDPSESESNSDKEDSEPSRSFSSSHSETKSSASESDSDTSVTDVSPLHSPERSPQSEDLKSKKRLKDRKADGVRFVDVTPGYSIHGKTRQQAQDSEARELSVLLRAVLEMDDYPDRSDLASLQKKMNRPSSGNPRRGGSRPRSAHMPHQRMNMSFSNDEVQKIDRENQRLLKKILTTNRTRISSDGSTTTSAGSRSSSQHLSHSAVRRQREQRQIELENMKILQRIESAKASPSIRRENLARHYQQQVQYSNQVGKSAHRPSSARQTGSTYVNKMAKASSMSSINSDFSKSSVATGSTRSRPSSGKRSVMSDTRPPNHARPAWDDHWHVT